MSEQTETKADTGCSLQRMVRQPKSMPANTRRALKESIAHWRRMAMGKSTGGEAPTASQCPLCDLFLCQKSPCRGCPVKRKFSAYCVGTPYHAAFAEYNAGEGIDSPEFKAAARRELQCLVALLPKKRKLPNSD